MKRLFLALTALLIMPPATGAQTVIQPITTITIDPGAHKVVAAVATKRTGRLKQHSTLLYKVEGIDQPVPIPGPRIKAVPDQRTYSDKFPVRNWIQRFSSRWGGSVGTAVGAAVGVRSTVSRNGTGLF